jgi:hypothetical protein
MRNTWNCLIPSKAPLPNEGIPVNCAGHSFKVMSGVYKYESGGWWWLSEGEWVEFSSPIYWSYLQ